MTARAVASMRARSRTLATASFSATGLPPGLSINTTTGVITGTVIDLAGNIGRLVLASPMPSRRLRVSPRVVKRAISKYNARGKIDRTTYKATIATEILTAAQEP